MASLSKLLREALGIDTAGDFPYTFPIIWEESLSKTTRTPKFEDLDISDVGPIIALSKELLQLIDITLNSYLTHISNFKRLPYQSLTIIDYLTKSPVLGVMFEALDISSYLTELTTWTRGLLVQLSIPDPLSWTWDAFRTLPEAIQLSDYIDSMTGVYHSLFDTMDIGDTLLQVWESRISIPESLSVSLFLYYTSQWYSALYQTVSISDLITISTGLIEIIIQSIDIEDYISDVWAATKSLIDTVAIGDFWDRAWGAYFSIFQSILMVDTDVELFIGIRRLITDTIALSDYWEYIWNYHFPPLVEQLTLFDTAQIPQFFKLTLVFFLWVFDHVNIEASIIGEFLEQITMFSEYRRIWSTSLDWPKTVEGILVFNYYSYAHDMVRPLADSLYLFDYYKWLTAWSRPLVESLTLVDYWVTAGITMLLADVLSLPSYLDTVSQFYRSFSDVIDVYTTVGPIWTIYRELAETLSIPDVYDSIWSVIWQYIDTFSLVDYTHWTSAWARLSLEPLVVGEYLYNSYRFVTKLLLNIEDFGTYKAQFYRMRLETLTITSALDYMGTFVREQVMQLSLVDDLDYLYSWTRVFTDTLLLFSDLSRIGTFTRRYTEDLDIASFIEYASSTIRSLYETLDITSYIDMVLNWYRMIVIEILDVSVDLSYTITWMRDYLEETDIASYMYSTVGVPMVEALSYLDYLATVTSYPREFIENLSLQDIFEYGWIVFSILLTEILDPRDYLITSTNFKRVIYQLTDISSYLQNIVSYARLPRESITLLDIHPVFAVTKAMTLFLSTVDKIALGVQKPLLDQLHHLGFLITFHSMKVDILHIILLTDRFTRRSWIRAIFRVPINIPDTLIIGAIQLYDATNLYLKKITADLTARFSRMIRA